MPAALSVDPRMTGNDEGNDAGTDRRFLESEPDGERAELLRRASAKAADPETWRWAVDSQAMLAAATANGTIMELLEELEK